MAMPDAVFDFADPDVLRPLGPILAAARRCDSESRAMILEIGTGGMQDRSEEALSFGELLARSKPRIHARALPPLMYFGLQGSGLACHQLPAMASPLTVRSHSTDAWLAGTDSDNQDHQDTPRLA